MGRTELRTEQVKEESLSDELIPFSDPQYAADNVHAAIKESRTTSVQFTCYDCGEVVTKRTIDYYDATGGINVSSQATIAFDSIRAGGDTRAFSVSSGEVTVNIGDEYKVSFDVATEILTGTSRSSSMAKLQLDTGSGFVDVAGTECYMYNRTSASSENSGASHAILTLTKGDKIRVIAERVAGSSTVQTIAGGSRLLIETTNKKEDTASLGIDCGDIGADETLAIYDCGEI